MKHGALKPKARIKLWPVHYCYITLFSILMPHQVIASSTAGAMALPMSAGLCTEMANLVSINKAFGLEPDFEIHEPRGAEYKNVDIDRDGIADSLRTTCGTGECQLVVELTSSNSSYSLVDNLFYLVRYKSKFYVVVGEYDHPMPDDLSKPDLSEIQSLQLHLKRLYVLTPHAAILVCGLE